ncbi:MAG: nitroreductase family protein [Candidatus Woesearchaeota archaeon]|jgi:nitroreductase
MSLKSIAKTYRKPEVEISSLFYTRWSPRAMNGKLLTKEELMPLFEAARWAPSSSNGQPWKFIVANTEKEKELFLNLLIDFNQQWCKHAGALVVVVSANKINNLPALTHSFDTGAAWMSLALEGSRRNLVVHAMQGFDYEKTRKMLNLPEEYTVECMIAIGKPGKISQLSPELAKRELPSTRKPLAEIIQWRDNN